MPLSFRLGAFYFSFFVYAGLLVAYFPPYLAARGLDAAQLAWLVALPQLARVVAPAAWGWIADRTGMQRAIVAFSCAANAACFALLPLVASFAAMAWLVAIASVLSAAALPLVEAITLGALAGQAGRYGPIRLWGSLGFILAVFARGAWLDFHPIHTLPAALVTFSIAGLGVALLLPPSAAHIAAPSLRLPANAATLLASAFFMAACARGVLSVFPRHCLPLMDLLVPLL